MSNPRRAQVNQKLYFVQLLLTDAHAKTGPAQQALLQGAVFHFATAYRLYLKEIAEHQHHTTDAIDARSARRQFAAQEWSCQELDVLAQLEEQAQWPLRLLQAMREAEGEAAPTAVKSSPGVISVADITEVVDVASCQQWLESFQSLIAVQREAAQEW
ncbi:MAG: DUF6586 family protein [Spongiibacteraceae bacterium]